MQVKIVVGTIAFMLTMMILGFAALVEPARLQRFTLAAEARSIETGASIFDGNCATCHGVQGRAEECYDSAGNQVGCQGLPLNNNSLLCGDRSVRMEAMNWEGTKRDFVLATVAAGRSGTAMPTWGENFGGPMRPDQVEDVANYVLNWESEALCAAPIITYDWPEALIDLQAEFEPGDATRGGDLFLTYGCSGCHGTLDDEASATVGPWLGTVVATAPSRIPDIEPEQYIYESILEPSSFIVEECPTGPCAGPQSLMLANFGERMGEEPQDMLDLIAYLLASQQ